MKKYKSIITQTPPSVNTADALYEAIQFSIFPDDSEIVFHVRDAENRSIASGSGRKRS